MSFTIGIPSGVVTVSAGVQTNATTASVLGFYGGAGVTQPSSYSTNATIGTTRANAVLTATTQSTASYTLVLNTSAAGGAANAGFATTATLRTFVDASVKAVDDIVSIKQLLNSIVNDLKSYNLSG